MTTYTDPSTVNVAHKQRVSVEFGLAALYNLVSVLEGDVTAPRITETALNHAPVNRAALKTATNSVSLTIGDGVGGATYETVTLDAYSFFPGTGGDGGTDIAFRVASGTVDPDAPQIVIGGTPSGNDDTVTLAWRYVVA